MNVESTPSNIVDNSSQDAIAREEGRSHPEDVLCENEAQLQEPQPESPEEASEIDLEGNLPEPDRDNITVFTNKLPNKPILPWNRYDSPWREEEEGEGEQAAAEISDDRETEVEEDEVE